LPELNINDENSQSIELSTQVASLFNDKDKQTSLGEQAHKVVMENQGASSKTLAEVKHILD
jgi:3-deoxy-D-manno-octulosonic-acid transferase